MSATLWLLPPRATTEVQESVSWLSSVLTSHDGHEQRAELRAAPLELLRFEFTADRDGDLVWLEAQLLAGWTGAWYMPLWPHRRRLTAALASGATTLYADLAWVPRLAQGGVYRFLLWTRSGALALLEATAVHESRLELLAGPADAWPAGSVLMPLLQGRLDSAPSLERIHRSAYAGRVSWTSDPVDAVRYLSPEPAASSVRLEGGYLGHDVATGLSAGERQWDGEGSERRATLVGSEAGKRSWRPQEPVASMTRTVHTLCVSAVQAEALRAFLDARRGRSVPFWLPTHNQDLLILSAEASTLDVFDPSGSGYADRLFDLGTVRRHLQIWADGAAPLYRSVLSLERQSATVVRLQLDSELPAQVGSGWIASYLRLCRLDTDAPQLLWQGESVTCDLPIRELGAECPAWRAAPEIPESLSYEDLGAWAIVSEGDLSVEAPEPVTVPSGSTLLVAIAHDEADESEIGSVMLGDLPLERLVGRAAGARACALYRLYSPVERTGTVSVHWQAIGGGIPDSPPLSILITAAAGGGVSTAASAASADASGSGTAADSGSTGPLAIDHALALAAVLTAGDLSSNPALWPEPWTGSGRLATDGAPTALALALACSIRTDPTALAAAKAVGDTDWVSLCAVLGAA